MSRRRLDKVILCAQVYTHLKMYAVLKNSGAAHAACHKRECQGQMLLLMFSYNQYLFKAARPDMSALEGSSNLHYLNDEIQAAQRYVCPQRDVWSCCNQRIHECSQRAVERGLTVSLCIFYAYVLVRTLWMSWYIKSMSQSFHFLTTLASFTTCEILSRSNRGACFS